MIVLRGLFECVRFLDLCLVFITNVSETRKHASEFPLFLKNWVRTCFGNYVFRFVLFWCPISSQFCSILELEAAFQRYCNILEFEPFIFHGICSILVLMFFILDGILRPGVHLGFV